MFLEQAKVWNAINSHGKWEVTVNNITKQDNKGREGRYHWTDCQLQLRLGRDVYYVESNTNLCSTKIVARTTHLVISRSSSSPNSPPIREGSPTTMTSWDASVNPEVLGDFFLPDVLFIPLLGADEFAFVDLRFRLVLGWRGVSAETEIRNNESFACVDCSRCLLSLHKRNTQKGKNKLEVL